MLFPYLFRYSIYYNVVIVRFSCIFMIHPHRIPFCPIFGYLCISICFPGYIFYFQDFLYDPLVCTFCSNFWYNSFFRLISPPIPVFHQYYRFSFVCSSCRTSAADYFLVCFFLSLQIFSKVVHSISKPSKLYFDLYDFVMFFPLCFLRSLVMNGIYIFFPITM